MLIVTLYALMGLFYGVPVGVLGFAFSTVMGNMDGPHQLYFDRIDKLGPWLKKPLGACAMCLSGQLALWSSGIVALITGDVMVIAALVFACGSAISTSYFLDRWYSSSL